MNLNSKLVEKLMGSRGRIRVLKALAEKGELNITQLSREVGMNHGCVHGHIDKLKELGLVREKWYGKVWMLEADFDEITIGFKKGLGSNLTLRLSV